MNPQKIVALASIPVVVIYFMFQNELTGGLTQGSVK